MRCRSGRRWVRVRTDVPPRPPLSAAERLAALIDGKLTRAEREEMIRILAASGTDREMLARVVLFLDDG